jgi:hypothetical protein
MSVYQTTLSLRGGYNLDRQLLEEIFHHATVFVKGNVDVEIEFGDVHKLNSQDLEALLEDSLIRTDMITGVEIKGRNYEVEPRRSFDFEANSESVFRATCRLQVSGEQEISRALSDRIERLIRVKRQWYSPILLNDTESSLIIVIAVVLLIFALPIGIAWVINATPRAALIIFMIEALGFWIWLYVLNRLRELLFPRLIFDIGRSAEVGKRSIGLQKFLFGAVFLTVILGVVASVIANFLYRVP